MKFIAKKTLDVVLRYPKIFNFNDSNYLIGSECINAVDNKIMQYWSCIYKLDSNFDIIHDLKYQLKVPTVNIEDYNISCWTRDINVINNKIYFNVEIKKNIGNKSYKHDNYIIFTENFINWFKIKQYGSKFEDYFIFKEINNNNAEILLLSILSDDKDFPDFFWRKYLFEFKINNQIIIPNFDSCVNYEQDKGHLLHNVINLGNNEYTIIFSIRHLINNTPEFVYKIYSAKTRDFINFNETTEINCINKINDTKWYSYPSVSKINNKDYMVTNQDDYGKHKHVLLFEIEN